MTLRESLEKYLDLIKVNFKVNTLYSLLFSIVYLGVLTIIQGVSYLEKSTTAFCLENFVAIIGIILMVPVFLPEEPKEIQELIASKPTPLFKQYITRIALASTAALSLIVGFSIILKYNSCIFPIIPYILGTFASAFFLGAIGVCVSSLTGNTIIGYMISLGYLIINMMTANKYVGKFYIMSMKMDSFEEKYYIFIGGIILLVIGLCNKRTATINL